MQHRTERGFRPLEIHSAFSAGDGLLVEVVAAAAAGLAIAPLARRIAPAGMIDVGTAFSLPKLGASKVMLYSRVSDAPKRAALRILAATFRREAGAK